MRTITAGERQIGAGSPCFLVAEAGINHNGDLKLAREMIEAAAEAGADAVKFQNYHTPEFLRDRSLTYEYVSQGKKVIEPQYDMFRRCELAGAALAELKRYCEKRNVMFFSTPMSEAGLAELAELRVQLVKNGSDCLTHLPLIRAMGRSGVPTILSTGMAREEEIARAIAAFDSAGGKELALLHCTSSYPTPSEDVNLLKIPALRERFQVPVGFSDHSDGITAALGAVALGACVIEKHFTRDRNLPGPDQRFSADPDEFTNLAREVRLLEKQMGSAALVPAKSEMENREQARLSCVAARELASGHWLNAQDVAFARPGDGLQPEQMSKLLGRRLKHAVSRGHAFRDEDLS